MSNELMKSLEGFEEILKNFETDGVDDEKIELILQRNIMNFLKETLENNEESNEEIVLKILDIIKRMLKFEYLRIEMASVLLNSIIRLIDTEYIESIIQLLFEWMKDEESLEYLLLEENLETLTTLFDYGIPSTQISILNLLVKVVDENRDDKLKILIENKMINKVVEGMKNRKLNFSLQKQGLIFLNLILKCKQFEENDFKVDFLLNLLLEHMNERFKVQLIFKIFSRLFGIPFARRVLLKRLPIVLYEYLIDFDSKIITEKNNLNENVDDDIFGELRSFFDLVILFTSANSTNNDNETHSNNLKHSNRSYMKSVIFKQSQTTTTTGLFNLEMIKLILRICELNYENCLLTEKILPIFLILLQQNNDIVNELTLSKRILRVCFLCFSASPINEILVYTTCLITINLLNKKHEIGIISHIRYISLITSSIVRHLKTTIVALLLQVAFRLILIDSDQNKVLWCDAFLAILPNIFEKYHNDTNIVGWTIGNLFALILLGENYSKCEAILLDILEVVLIISNDDEATDEEIIQDNPLIIGYSFSILTLMLQHDYQDLDRILNLPLTQCSEYCYTSNACANLCAFIKETIELSDSSKRTEFIELAEDIIDLTCTQLMNFEDHCGGMLFYLLSVLSMKDMCFFDILCENVEIFEEIFVTNLNDLNTIVLYVNGLYNFLEINQFDYFVEQGFTTLVLQTIKPLFSIKSFVLNQFIPVIELNASHEQKTRNNFVLWTSSVIGEEEEEQKLKIDRVSISTTQIKNQEQISAKTSNFEFIYTEEEMFDQYDILMLHFFKIFSAILKITNIQEELQDSIDVLDIVGFTWHSYRKIPLFKQEIKVLNALCQKGFLPFTNELFPQIIEFLNFFKLSKAVRNYLVTFLFNLVANDSYKINSMNNTMKGVNEDFDNRNDTTMNSTSISMINYEKVNQLLELFLNSDVLKSFLIFAEDLLEFSLSCQIINRLMSNIFGIIENHENFILRMENIVKTELELFNSFIQLYCEELIIHKENVSIIDSITRNVELFCRFSTDFESLNVFIPLFIPRIIRDVDSSKTILSACAFIMECSFVDSLRFILLNNDAVYLCSLAYVKILSSTNQYPFKIDSEHKYKHDKLQILLHKEEKVRIRNEHYILNKRTEDLLLFQNNPNICRARHRNRMKLERKRRMKFHSVYSIQRKILSQSQPTNNSKLLNSSLNFITNVALILLAIPKDIQTVPTTNLKVVELFELLTMLNFDSPASEKYSICVQFANNILSNVDNAFEGFIEHDDKVDQFMNIVADWLDSNDSLLIQCTLILISSMMLNKQYCILFYHHDMFKQKLENILEKFKRYPSIRWLCYVIINLVILNTAEIKPTEELLETIVHLIFIGLKFERHKPGYLLFVLKLFYNVTELNFYSIEPLLLANDLPNRMKYIGNELVSELNRYVASINNLTFSLSPSLQNNYFGSSPLPSLNNLEIKSPVKVKRKNKNKDTKNQSVLDEAIVFDIPSVPSEFAPPLVPSTPETVKSLTSELFSSVNAVPITPENDFNTPDMPNEKGMVDEEVVVTSPTKYNIHHSDRMKLALLDELYTMWSGYLALLSTKPNIAKRFILCIPYVEFSLKNPLRTNHVRNSLTVFYFMLQSSKACFALQKLPGFSKQLDKIAKISTLNLDTLDMIRFEQIIQHLLDVFSLKEKPLSQFELNTLLKKVRRFMFEQAPIENILLENRNLDSH
eukprot:TRINITY_DN1903_c0_g1_i1.p1 TRINITY_DN1903_c0_g1~~TRINITY_DN1903_c0_g1_i1.p1  ORF type:complete len:1701 (-),score=444.37 TRINITY_DN1903_c0_g1_i1:15-5117(-)